MVNETPSKADVTKMLRRYDRMYAELRALERELNKKCANYGRAIGVWGFTRDHLRMQLESEKKGKVA